MNAQSELARHCHRQPRQAATFKIGESAEEIDLPIGVKCMKRRTVKLKVYKVTEDGKGDDPDNPADLVPTEDQLQSYLNNQVYGPQINTVFQVKIPPEPLEIDWKTESDPSSWMEVGAANSNSEDQQLFVDAVSGPNGEFPADADIVVFLVGSRVLFGGTSAGATGIANRTAKMCWVVGDAVAAIHNTVEEQMRTIAHEIGHILIDYGHPDEPDLPGPAQLLGTVHAKRLMVSGLGGGDTPGVLLVKAEWDAAEVWLADEIDSND